jgi:hypothetical protein
MEEVEEEYAQDFWNAYAALNHCIQLIEKKEAFHEVR